MARANLYIKTGSYTGTGSALTITGVGFQPTLVIVKTTSQHAVMRNSHNVGDDTSYLDTALANITGGITGFTTDGFTLGTSATVNGNGVVSYYIAMRGTAAQQYLRTGRYAGNGVDDRNLTSVGLTFQPDLVDVKANSATSGAARMSSNVGDSSGPWSGSFGTNKIQSFLSNGFQVGSNVAVNATSTDYYYWAVKQLSNAIYTSSYSGTGVAQDISVPFQPDVIFVKDITGSNTGIIKIADMGAANSMLISNGALAATHITAVSATTFTIGTTANVNNSGSTYIFTAMKAGNYSAPLSRLSS